MSVILVSGKGIQKPNVAEKAAAEAKEEPKSEPKQKTQKTAAKAK